MAKPDKEDNVISMSFGFTGDIIRPAWFKSDASYPCTQIGEVLDVPRKKGKNGAEVSKV